MGSQLLLTGDDLWFNGAPTSGGRWKDGSDSTWGTISQTGATPTYAAFMYSWLDPYTGEIRADATITLQTRIQVSTTELGSTIPFGASIVFDIPGGGSTIPFTDAHWVTGTVPKDGAYHDLSFPLTFPASPGDFTIEQVLTRLAGGSTGDGTGIGLRALRFTVRPFGGSLASGETRTFFIAEASVLVSWPDPEPPLPPVEVEQETRCHFEPVRRG